VCRASGGRGQFWATGTLDIGGDGWKTFADESEVNVNFTDNGNDPGPVVAKLAVGNANAIYEVAGLKAAAKRSWPNAG